MNIAFPDFAGMIKVENNFRFYNSFSLVGIEKRELPMLISAVWPVSTKESRNQIDGIISLLNFFSTKNITLLHIIEKGERVRKQVSLRLQKLEKELKETNFHVETQVRSGHVASSVCDFAREQKGDFIILPWKTKTIVQRALLGNTVRDVIRLSNRPVAVYRDVRWARRNVEHEINRIMYATSFQATDRVVLPYLKHEGLKANKLYLLNVGDRAPDPEAEKKRLAGVESKLAGLAAECADNYEQIETISELGRPYQKILQKARSEMIDLIVAGKYDKASPFRALMGSVAEHLPHRSPCSILIIPLESLAVR